MNGRKRLTVMITGAFISSLAGATDIMIRSYEIKDLPEIKEILEQLNWPSRCVDVQLRSIEKLSQDEEGNVFVAARNDMNHNKVLGLIQVQHHGWNQVSFIHGLYVGVNFRRQGIAHNLIDYVENLAKSKGQRGVFLDTPVDNKVARLFYQACQYQEAYIMPNYYEEGLDGVTYLKMFKN